MLRFLNLVQDNLGCGSFDWDVFSYINCSILDQMSLELTTQCVILLVTSHVQPHVVQNLHENQQNFGGQVILKITSAEFKNLKNFTNNYGSIKT